MITSNARAAMLLFGATLYFSHRRKLREGARQGVRPRGCDGLAIRRIESVSLKQSSETERKVYGCECGEDAIRSRGHFIDEGTTTNRGG